MSVRCKGPFLRAVVIKLVNKPKQAKLKNDAKDFNCHCPNQQGKTGDRYQEYPVDHELVEMGRKFLGSSSRAKNSRLHAEARTASSPRRLLSS